MNNYHRIVIVLLIIAATTAAVIIKKTQQSDTTDPDVSGLETQSDSANMPAINAFDVNQTSNSPVEIKEPNDMLSGQTPTVSLAANINDDSPEAVGGTSADLKSSETGVPRLVDFGASKCIACKMMEPILEELSKGYADVFKVEFVNVFAEREKTNQNGIRMIPTQIFYDSAGKELYRHTGYYSKEDILAKWKELGVDVSKK